MVQSTKDIYNKTNAIIVEDASIRLLFPLGFCYKETIVEDKWYFPCQPMGDGKIGRMCISSYVLVDTAGHDLAVHVTFNIDYISLHVTKSDDNTKRIVNANIAVSNLHFTARSKKGMIDCGVTGTGILDSALHVSPNWEWTSKGFNGKYLYGTTSNKTVEEDIIYLNKVFDSSRLILIGNGIIRCIKEVISVQYLDILEHYKIILDRTITMFGDIEVIANNYHP